MKSLIAHGCVQETCLSETAWFEIHRKLPRMFLHRVNCLLVTCTDCWHLTKVGGAKGVPPDEWHLSRPIRLCFAHTETDGCHLSGGLPDGLSEVWTGAWRARSFRGVLMNGLRLNRIKARASSQRTGESRKLSFSISEKNPQSLSFNPSWQGWGSIHLTLFSIALFFSLLLWISRVLQWWSNSMGS